MMKKYGFLLLIVCVGLMVCPHQAISANVNTYTIPEITTAPVIDGDLSDAVWASVPAIPMDMLGDSPPATPGTKELDIVLKVAWNDSTNALYFGINVIDDAFVGVRGMGSSQGTDGYNNERLEIIIDGTNTQDAASNTTSGLHQQYTFDLPNTFDDWDPTNDIAKKILTPSLVGYLNTDYGGIKPSSTFVPVPVFERIEGTLNFDNTHSPWDISNDFCESAAKIRVTDPAATIWIEAPVEINWEVKIVPYAFLLGATALGFDIADPANIANGWVDLFKDSANEVLDMKAGMSIGFTAQQNDSDVWDAAPARNHQTNTTGVAGNWNSSESLTELILGAKATSVPNWELQ